MCSGMLAAATLFVEYRLESVRQRVLEAAESRLGIGLDAYSVTAAGLRGIRIDDLRIALNPEGGPAVNISVPNTYVYIDVIGLFYGEVNIDRIELDHAVFRLRRPPGETWFNTGPETLLAQAPFPLASVGAFRVIGRGCTLEIENVVRDTELSITNLDFDVYRLSGSHRILGSASGHLNGRPENLIETSLSYASPLDFEAKLEAGHLSSEEVNVFLPASQRFVETGAARPKARVAAYPDNSLMVWLEADFQNLTIRDQPPFLGPATGSLEILASYNTISHLLTLNSASAESAQIGVGKLTGTVSFEEKTPEFDLHIQSSRLPLAEILDLAVTGRIQNHGALDVELSEPYGVTLSLAGNLEAPRISAQANAGGGALSYTPHDNGLPTIMATLQDVSGAWDSHDDVARATLNVSGGTVVQQPLGIDVKDISGLFHLEDRLISVQPLNFVFQGNPMVGGLNYDFAERAGTASLNGTIARLEETRLADAIPDVALSGTSTLRVSADLRPERATADFSVELTQAQVDYKWFFRKPDGLGITLHGTADLHTDKELTLEGQIRAADTVVDTELFIEKSEGGWNLHRALMAADTADIATVSRCLRLPYMSRGGAILDASYEWVRDSAEPKAWRSMFECRLDELRLLPTGLDTPHEFKDIQLRLALTRGQPSTGEMWLHASSAVMPPFGEQWFNPVQCPPELIDRFPPLPRDWVLHLDAERLAAPPWEGRDFSGAVFFTEAEMAVPAFEALVGEGRVNGKYVLNRAENTVETAFAWEQIPATPLLKHLKFPDVLDGTATGDITYSMDRDDPHTQTGRGRFEVINGRFNGDYLLAQFREQLEQSAGMLPPSLKFDRLASLVSFEKDVVTTQDAELVAEGIRITGDGSYVTGGEMDYDIRLAISPDTAERIPALRDNFALQGYRLANRNLELEFRVEGPTLRPRSELASLPAPSITFVSGALETTSDVMRVLDLPRKILVDVFKMGAGIVGARRAPEDTGK